MDNNFMVVRHSYDDHSYIDGKNDTPLTPRGIDIAKKAIVHIEPKLQSNEIIITHSARKRALETTEIFYDYLLKKGFNCKYECDKNLTELYQGNLNFGDMSHEDRVNFLQSCWDDFEECRLNGILDHRFGQNKDRSVILNPGETHNEWSQRISSSLLNTINNIEQGYQVIDIVHRGVIYEIEQLVKLSNGEINYKDVEQYKTRWMEYCQDYILHLNDLDYAKETIKTYQRKRG